MNEEKLVTLKLASVPHREGEEEKVISTVALLVTHSWHSLTILLLKPENN